ncbi:minor tail protein [Arthrobacter phage JKerns]|uniref:Minor tail protein n=1 Tax=Arthrobacter phage JKerns TaxID=2719212 RepID=A0A6G9LDW8_9CAUD|nr:minor tail protein [Arthrobacter phage JKerns]
MLTRNRVTTGARALTDWGISNAAGTTGASSIVGDELVYSSTTAQTGGSGGPYLREKFTSPLGMYSARLQIKSEAGRTLRVPVTVRNGSTDVIGKGGTNLTSSGDWQDVIVEDIDISSPFTYIQIWPQLSGSAPAGELLRVRNIAIFESAKVSDYFDGNTPNGYGFDYGWEGAIGASVSYRIETIDLLHSWTRKLWASLPNAYRMADAVQDPSIGYFPLLRWLNGVGALAGEMRDLSDAIWNNELTDVTKTPDAALRWIAQILGMSESQRAVSLTDLRAAVAELTAGGRPAIGTRRSIAEATKRFLTGEKQVTVVPSSVTPHTIVLLVRAAEVPGGNLVTLANNVRSTGVIPAGHNVVAQNAIATWDSFMAAAGATWNELDGKAGTWSQHDTIGVVLEA